MRAAPQSWSKYTTIMHYNGAFCMIGTSYLELQMTVLLSKQRLSEYFPNIFWLLSWETVKQEVGFVWVSRHRSLQYGNG